MSDAIQQERDRLARILEAEALKRSPLTDNGVTQRVTYAIAARIVRRGRALRGEKPLNAIPVPSRGGAKGIFHEARDLAGAEGGQA